MSNGRQPRRGLLRTSEQTELTMTLSDLRRHLDDLACERATAALHGLDRDAAYMADLENEERATHAAYVGAAVTEIASLRAQLGAPLQG
jgi:hypothetical protein